jgi:hypothetical protein
MAEHITRWKEHLTVIGAGPKAVALAAKRRVLAERGLPVPELLVIDRRGTGANWSGDYGYTNGDLILGTAPEKDIGFPYETEEFNPVVNHEINKAMLNYSWLAYKISEKRRSFADWIDRGRPMPKHRQWAGYLEWVAELVEMPVRQGEVSEIALSGNRWLLAFDNGEKVETDGLVITSPGPPKRSIELRGGAEGAVLNGKDFWEAEGEKRRRDLVAGPSRICVIGSGETAAAIVVHLAGELRNTSVEIVSRDGIIFTRGESYEENRLFSDPERWEGFSAEVRKDFVRRADRGVFSATCKATINECDFVETVGGEAEWIDYVDEHFLVGVEGEERGPYDLVVDGTGFRRDWFLDLMDQGAGRALMGALPKTEKGASEMSGQETDSLFRNSDRIDLVIDSSLAVMGLEPLLHLPMFSAFVQGPGFPSLGCLGTLSDRILAPYLDSITVRAAEGHNRGSDSKRVHAAEPVS